MPEVRLIDANALAESDMAKLIDRYLYNQCNLTVGLAAALMPEIEAEPVRHGRWIFVGEETMPDGWTYRKHKCTECDFVTVEAKNFCQNCGAKMDGGADNAE